MANITAYFPVDMSGTEVSDTGDAYIEDSFHLFIIDGGEIVHYYGFGFDVDEFGNLISGTLNSVVNILNGITQFEITGLNHSIVAFNNYLLANDAQGAYAFLFSGNENLTGSPGNDYFIGYAGNDTLAGLGGTDSLVGGDGNDTYVFDGVDFMLEVEGGGFDTIHHDFSYTLPLYFEGLVLGGAGSINGAGNAVANHISGNAGNNRLVGLGGADSLIGGDGADTLDGGEGVDSMVGGAGADHYWVDHVGDVVVDVADANAIDVIWASVSIGLPAHVENLYLTGSANLSAGGNNEDNYIIGNSGNNSLGGGAAGNDTIDGGAGADVIWGGGDYALIFVDDPDDMVYGYHASGYEVVRSSVSYSLSHYIERLELIDSARDATGNGRANFLLGNAQNNVLNGAGGLDTLSGGVGDDTYLVDAIQWPHQLEFSGPPGEYITQGDSYSFAGSTGIFSVLSVDDLSGDDLVDSLTFHYDDGRHWWYLEFGAGPSGVLQSGDYLGARGGSLDYPEFRIYGDGRGSGSSFGAFTVHDIVIDYSGDAPVLLKFAADFEHRNESPAAPLLSGSMLYDLTAGWEIETVVELENQGNDVLVSTVDAYLPNNIEHLKLTGSGNINGSGNSAVNLLSGNSGNNVLDGAAGADIIAGGLGNDTYVIDHGGDQVMELGGSGTDSVQSAVAYSLMQAWHVENLTLIGGHSINGAGNWLDNVINGNAAANRIDGNRGNDTIDGGGGVDTLIGGLGDDVLVWDALDALVQGGAGSDTLLINGGGVTLNLLALSDVLITDIEVINIAGSSSNTLTLGLADVLAISSTTDQLRVDGDAGDVLNLQGSWNNAGTAGGYVTYGQGLATLLVDTDITVVSV